MKNKLVYILSIFLVIALSVIVYQNFIQSTSDMDSGHTHTNNGEKQLYTCGMHPDIISEEPGNCPICEMKLTPIKDDKSTSNTEREILYWVAPMDPNEVYDEPGKSKMGMDLVPVYADEVAGGGIVKIDPAVQQNMNVRTEVIKSHQLNNKINTNGIVKVDETNEYIISSRIGGWIENMYVNSTGQTVNKGETLLEIYSPELVAAQEELISAMDYGKQTSSKTSSIIKDTGDELVSSAIEKLKLLELKDHEIKQILSDKKVRKYLPVQAPTSGVVLMKKVLEGEKIMPGSSLLHIADLRKLWIIADIYENEIAKVEKGMQADIDVPAYPNKTFSGVVDFIYPTIDNQTRTGKVRIVVSNNNMLLKPAMLAKVEINGNDSDILPVIPEQSVIRSGEKDIVVLSLGEGKFKPVEVQLGNYADGMYQVTSGLAEGITIVTSAQFLIDSESNLKAAITMFGAKPDKNDTNSNDHDQKQRDNDQEQEYEQEQEEKGENEYGIDSPLVRTGVIDVESIDGNGDGKLYECPMDWNIISDESGRCPSCEMKLKEYSLDEIKGNLKKYGYEYLNNNHDHKKHGGAK